VSELLDEKIYFVSPWIISIRALAKHVFFQFIKIIHFDERPKDDTKVPYPMGYGTFLLLKNNF